MSPPQLARFLRSVSPQTLLQLPQPVRPPNALTQSEACPILRRTPAAVEGPSRAVAHLLSVHSCDQSRACPRPPRQLSAKSRQYRNKYSRASSEPAPETVPRSSIP